MKITSTLAASAVALALGATLFLSACANPAGSAATTAASVSIADTQSKTGSACNNGHDLIVSELVNAGVSLVSEPDGTHRSEVGDLTAKIVDGEITVTSHDGGVGAITDLHGEFSGKWSASYSLHFDALVGGNSFPMQVDLGQDSGDAFSGISDDDNSITLKSVQGSTFTSELPSISDEQLVKQAMDELGLSTSAGLVIERGDISRTESVIASVEIPITADPSACSTFRFDITNPNKG